ncbi:hypothetical protein ES703_10243 [subsurface metagenome]
MNVEPKIIYLDERNEVKHAYASHEKVKSYFNVTPKYSLQEGLYNMADWAKKVGIKRSKEFKNIEINKNIPKSWIIK